MFFGIAIKLKEFGKDFLIGGVFLVDLRDCRVGYVELDILVSKSG